MKNVIQVIKGHGWTCRWKSIREFVSVAPKPAFVFREKYYKKLVEDIKKTSSSYTYIWNRERFLLNVGLENCVRVN